MERAADAAARALSAFSTTKSSACLRGKDALLGQRVVFEAAVAVKVVGRDVEDDGDGGMELLQCFQAGSWRLQGRTRCRRCFRR